MTRSRPTPRGGRRPRARLHLDLREAAESLTGSAARAPFGRLSERFGGGLGGMFVQVMAEDEGVAVLCGAFQDEVFGIVVVFGAAGVGTGAPADRGAGDLIGAARPSAPLHGRPARPPCPVVAVRQVLPRPSRPAADHPEIIELDLTPAIVRPDGVVAGAVRVRPARRRAWDPCPLRLR